MDCLWGPLQTQELTYRLYTRVLLGSLIPNTIYLGTTLYINHDFYLDIAYIPDAHIYVIRVNNNFLLSPLTGKRFVHHGSIDSGPRSFVAIAQYYAANHLDTHDAPNVVNVCIFCRADDFRRCFAEMPSSGYVFCAENPSAISIKFKYTTTEKVLGDLGWKQLEVINLNNKSQPKLI